MYIVTPLVNFFLDALKVVGIINENRLKELCVDAVIHYAGYAAR